nr:Leucine rich repeat typical subtype [Hymenolepis microstoma]
MECGFPFWGTRKSIPHLDVLVVVTAFQSILIPAFSTNSSELPLTCHFQLEQDVRISKDLLKSLSEDCTEISIISTDTAGRIIDVDAFQKFSHLTSLTIRTNLSTVENYLWLQVLKGLEYLNLSHCHIKFLNTGDFTSGFPNLRIVDLSHNFMPFIFLPFLFRTPKLEYLNLSSNSFKNFPDISSSFLTVNFVNNPLQCTCTNVELRDRGNFLTSGYNCDLSPCPYYLAFNTPTSTQNISPLVSENFNISCRVNASSGFKLGIFSPIGFIPDPSYDNNSNGPLQSTYQYTVLPVQQSVRIIVQRSESSLLATINYARGHHAGVWRCAALSEGGLFLDNQIQLVNISTGIRKLFLRTAVLGFIVMAITLALGLIIGGCRYLIETDCFRQPQKHKYVVRPIIGVIPVPAMDPIDTTFVEDIPIDQRVCPSCMTKPFFFCGYCNDHHIFSNFVVKRNADAIPRIPSPSYRNNSPDNVTVYTSGTQNVNREDDEEADDDRIESIEVIPPKNSLQNSHENVSNYVFPSEFCHCHHLEVRFTNEGEVQASATLRDVKLICQDEQLAQEYTEVLERLQAAAKSNDPVTFKVRLDEFRGRLVHDVGRRVRIAREGIVAFTERSARSVARLRDQGGVVVQFMKAGLSQVRDGMRSVAELCTGGSDESTESVTDPVETIGQSISVVSIYKDGTTKKTKERFVSNFRF